MRALFLCLLTLMFAGAAPALAANVQIANGQIANAQAGNATVDDGVDAAPANATVATPTPTPSPSATPQIGNEETRAIAEGRQPAPQDATAAGIALLRLFLMAVVLERALALLFNWRPFLANFDGSGVKTPIAFVVAMLITHYFQPDALIRLFQAYGNPLPETDSAGQFLARTLEAMVIAGGSAGVSQLMRQLGFQPPQTAQELRPTPKSDDEAWISVALDGPRGAVAFPAYVQLAAASGPAVEVGTIYQYSGRQSFASYFFRNRGRFPQSGGYAVTPGVTYTISVVDSAGKIYPVPGTHTLGPRAVIDIVVTV